MSTTKVNVTYRNLILLGLALGGVIFFAQQILADLNIAFFHFKIGGFNFMSVFGFVTSLWGTWRAFEATKKTESKEEQSSHIKFLETQYQLVMREIDENKREIEKVEKEIKEVSESLISQARMRGERIGESEQKIYALSLQIDGFQDVVERFILLEHKTIGIDATVNLLATLMNKETEFDHRIERLEKKG